MLTDREIEAAYARMRDRIDLVNAEYLKAVARQINAIGGLNASSIRKLAQMRIYRANAAKIKEALAKALNLSAQELQELLERAAREVYADADYMAVIRGRRLVPLEYNEPLKKYISAVSAQTEERFHNYSNTTCIDENYQEAVTNAIDAVARGVTDYHSAIRDTMRKLGGDGIRITYESGITRRMDTALRQNVLDGVKQIQQEAQRLIGEEIGATGVELSAHPFSAVDHEPAQGRQFSLQEFSRMQDGQPFTDADGNRYGGFKRPIGEWNCRHFASYIILGVSPRRYTDAQLKAWKEMNHKGCTIGGKHYTVYEASQLIRQLEARVRQQKDIANLAKLTGDDKLRREAQSKIVTLKAQYKAVSEASGLKQRAERMVAEGYTKQQTKEATKIQDALQFIQNDGIIKASSELPKRISLPDETLKATAEVEFDNLHGVVPKGSSLSEVYAMAGNGTSTPIRDLKRLYAKYPEAGHPSGWQKKSGTTYSSNGKYVVHWYENDGHVPPGEVKTKGVKLT